MQVARAASSTCDSWIAAARATVEAIVLRHESTPRSDSVDRVDVEALRLRAAQLAWRGDCPNAADFFASDERETAPRYRRRLIARGDDDRYTALLIAWPAGHRTPLHDHDGLWGIELVLDGALGVDEFRVDRAAGDDGLQPQRSLMLGVGDAAAFEGTDYVHECRNLSPRRPALSLHIYGGSLLRYAQFDRVEDGVRYRKSLHDTHVDVVSV